MVSMVQTTTLHLTTSNQCKDTFPVTQLPTRCMFHSPSNKISPTTIPSQEPSLMLDPHCLATLGAVFRVFSLRDEDIRDITNSQGQYSDAFQVHSHFHLMIQSFELLNLNFHYFIAGEGERDCDSRSTISSQLSDNERQTLSNSTEAAFSQLFQTEPNQESNSEDAVRDPINERLKVWKLQDIPFDDTNRSTLSPSPFSVVNTFTLQETLFIEQLTSIDERVRVQVREIMYIIQIY